MPDKISHKLYDIKLLENVQFSNMSQTCTKMLIFFVITTKTREEQRLIKIIYV